ncbi:hypothetical protein FRC06_000848 [Ceratobasidium sp. 370]|nr:hypothetical protein FRC06_000848 [Ceratobasidium sp. 370]
MGSPPRSVRSQHATKRFEEYCGDDNLTLFSQSIGLPAPPHDPATEQAEQAKKQKVAVKARGNATQLGPLPPAPKCRKAGDGKALIDRPLDNFHTEEDCVEWLYQALERLDNKTDYRGDPDMQDSAALWEVYQDLLDGRAADPQPNANIIRSGMLRELQTHKSSHQIGVKLVPADHTTLGRDSPPPNAHNHHNPDQPVCTPAKLAQTDHTTIGLDSRSPHAHHHHEFGQPIRTPAPKLIRTNRMAIGLDGVPPPPKSQVAQHHNTTTKSPTNAQGQNPPHPTAPAPTTTQPAPTLTTTRSVNNPAVLKKHASKGKAADTSAAMLDNDGDVPMEDPTLSGGGSPEPLPPQTGEEQGLAGGALLGGQDDDNDNALVENQGSRQRQARENPLVMLFGDQGAQLVSYVLANIKVKVATTCGFPDHVRSVEDPEKMLFEVWVAQICGQLPIMCNGVKKWAEPVIPVYFELDHSDPDHARKAHNLIDNEKWLSLNLANDEEIFNHKIIRNVIKFAFFCSAHSLGTMNWACFIPLVLIETIAYACAIIHHLIGSYQFDAERSNDLNSGDDVNNVRNYMRLLKEIGDHDPTALMNI